MSLLSEKDVITYLSFFFVDIVGLSDPLMSTNTQVSKIKALNKAISECITFQTARKDEVLGLPTGDGIAIGFSKGLEKPLLLAKELHLRLNYYNHEKPVHERVSVRIGCNDGHVFVVNDVYGNLNVWGPGIVLARRVMDLGDSGHILMTSSMAETLMELSEEYRQMLHLVRDFQIKHGRDLLLYSVYGKGFGNPANPEKGLENRTEITSTVREPDEKIAYRRIELTYAIKQPDSNVVQFTKKCYVQNLSEEPIFLLVERITNVEKPISDINLRVFDEENKEIRICSIISGGSGKKEFVIKFPRPIFPGEHIRVYSLTYHIEFTQRCIGELYERGCEDLSVIFKHSREFSIEPRLTHTRNGQDIVLEKESLVGSSDPYIARWMKCEGTLKGDVTKLEW